MERAWAAGPIAVVTVEIDGRSWATALSSRVSVTARAADGPLAFRQANWARARPRPESDGASAPDPTDGGWGLRMVLTRASDPIYGRNRLPLVGDGIRRCIFFSPTKFTFSPTLVTFSPSGVSFSQRGLFFANFFDHARVLYSEPSASDRSKSR